jgi:hypothetical protein
MHEVGGTGFRKSARFFKRPTQGLIRGEEEEGRSQEGRRGKGTPPLFPPFLKWFSTDWYKISLYNCASAQPKD